MLVNAKCYLNRKVSFFGVLEKKVHKVVVVVLYVYIINFDSVSKIVGHAY